MKKPEIDYIKLVIEVERDTREGGLVWEEIRPQLYTSQYDNYTLQFCTKRMQLHIYIDELYLGYANLHSNFLEHLRDRFYENVVAQGKGYTFLDPTTIKLDLTYFDLPFKETDEIDEY